MKNLLLLVCIGFLLLTKTSFAQQDLLVDEFLSAQVAANQINQEDASDYVILSRHKSKSSNLEHIYFRQSYGGTQIIGTESSIHVNRDNTLLKSNFSFESSIHKKITGAKSPSITPQLAIQKIAQQMGYYLPGNLISKPKSYVPNADYVFSISGIPDSSIPVKLVYKKLEHSKYILAWELSLQSKNNSDWYNFYADAETGDIITKNNWTLTCLSTEHDHTSHEISRPYYGPEEAKTVFKSNINESNGGTYNVFPIPFEDPFLDPRQMVTAPENSLASPLGWHDTDGSPGAEFTVTRGNNVNAYEDGDNQGFQPDGGNELVFDFPFNPVFNSGDQSESAAITNLFYWNNVIHDIVYQYGFDEASGNFQVNNYGNPGIGNDPVSAEAQDGSGTCNANFSSPPEGIASRMQMYICGQRDGDFDNGVIIHEYGHGISIRLTGGGTNSDCLFNDEQMGEGWSDWYGAVMTIREGDTGTDARPIGNWLFGNDSNGPGIRAFPYSTDLAVNPQTYDDIKSTFGPHPLGSIWATMLWEMTWALIDDHGFDPDLYNGSGGNNIALALVTEALKLQPCSPGFVDGRDAILAADQALFGGENYCTIWDAFAKRGLGQSADQGSSFSRTDGTEAFDSPSTQFSTPDTVFCVTDDVQVFGGGLPLGGVYSGPGVINNGDGESYSFDPLEAGIGTHTITYNANSECGANSEATDTIEVKDENPVIECQDITVTLDQTGIATIEPEDIVTNFEPGDGYSLDQSGTFSPEDISGIENSVSLGDDQVSNSISMDFDFNFYGNSYSAFSISSNGYITFSDDFSSGCCSGQILPNTNQPNNLIALGWTDLNPSNGGFISYATTGNTPNRVLVVQFDDVPNFGNSSRRVSAQIKLFENSNRIEIHSENVEGFGLTQGIENSDGSQALAVPGRNSQEVSITNDVVAFVPNQGGFPDNCGQETTVTLDINTFDCTNLGENTVTATATDALGNSSSCTATVTVISDIDVTLAEINEEFCVDQSPITGLSGGLPLGGIYSGDGVIDDGNGETFTFDPGLAGEGTTTITYNGNNSCSELGSASIDVEILAALPQIECFDLTIPLDSDGIVTITAEQLLSQSRENNTSYGKESKSQVPIDNCSGEPLTLNVSPDTFTCDNVGVNVVTVTATDADGNSTSCSSIVTIEDDSSLEFECIDSIELELDENDSAILTEEMVFNLLPTDVCENGYTVALSQSNFDCDDVNNEEQEQDLIINGSFENDLTGWTSTVENGAENDSAGSCNQTWKSLMDSSTICCCVNDIFPTNGDRASFTSFDGEAGVKYVLEQTIQLNTSSSFNLSFDWVGEFQLGSASLDRTFEVGIYALDGTLIETIYNESIPAGEATSINRTISLEIGAVLSDFQNQEIALKFIATIPETYTGPSKAMIDNVSLMTTSSTIPVEVTVTSTSGNTRTCTVPVIITDPNEFCTLSTQDKFFDNAFNLYPNPTKASFTLAWNTEVSVESLEVLDLTGKLILQKQVGQTDLQTSVDVSNLSSGIYLVRVSSNSNQSIKKLVIE